MVFYADDFCVLFRLRLEKNMAKINFGNDVRKHQVVFRLALIIAMPFSLTSCQTTQPIVQEKIAAATDTKDSVTKIDSSRSLDLKPIPLPQIPDHPPRAFYADVPPQPDQSVDISSYKGNPIQFLYVYPYSASQLSARLMKIVEGSRRHIQRKDVEKILNIQFKSIGSRQSIFSGTNPNAKFFEVKRDVSAYFDADVVEDVETNRKRLLSFSFNWGNVLSKNQHRFPPPPKNICIDVNKMAERLRKLGWREGELRPSWYGPAQRVFTGPKGQFIEIAYQKSAPCLLSFWLSFRR